MKRFLIPLLIVLVSCSSIDETVKSMNKRSNMLDKQIITAEMIKELPKPVKKYFNFANVIGSKFTHSVYLKQKGLFFVKDNWEEIEAEQWFNTNTQEFLWSAELDAISVVDKFIENKGA